MQTSYSHSRTSSETPTTRLSCPYQPPIAVPSSDLLIQLAPRWSLKREDSVVVFKLDEHACISRRVRCLSGSQRSDSFSYACLLCSVTFPACLNLTFSDPIYFVSGVSIRLPGFTNAATKVEATREREQTIFRRHFQHPRQILWLPGPEIPLNKSHAGPASRAVRT